MFLVPTIQVRLVGDFTVPNLLSTHPALQPVKKLASEVRQALLNFKFFFCRVTYK